MYRIKIRLKPENIMKKIFAVILIIVVVVFALMGIRYYKYSEMKKQYGATDGLLKINGIPVMWEYVPRKKIYSIEYFKKIDDNYSYDDIVNDVGKPNGWRGSGISNPFWLVDGKCILVKLSLQNQNEISKVVLCSEDEEIEVFYSRN